VLRRRTGRGQRREEAFGVRVEAWGHGGVQRIPSLGEDAWTTMPRAGDVRGTRRRAAGGIPPAGGTEAQRGPRPRRVQPWAAPRTPTGWEETRRAGARPALPRRRGAHAQQPDRSQERIQRTGLNTLLRAHHDLAARAAQLAGRASLIGCGAFPPASAGTNPSTT
jgi:hypothetical protein